MDEILRNGNPQILLAIMATCSVSVAKAKQVRTLAVTVQGVCKESEVVNGARRGRADIPQRS
jgi:hypothetical protein